MTGTAQPDTSRTLNFLASAGPLANTTCDRAEANAIMLQTGGQLLAAGYLYNIICKRIGPDVWRLSLKRAN